MSVTLQVLSLGDTDVPRLTPRECTPESPASWAGSTLISVELLAQNPRQGNIKMAAWTNIMTTFLTTDTDLAFR